MNLIPRWLRARPRADDETFDAADMGTAYGLDASFDELAPQRAAPPPASAAPWLSERTGLPRDPGTT